MFYDNGQRYSAGNYVAERGVLWEKFRGARKKSGGTYDPERGSSGTLFLTHSDTRELHDTVYFKCFMCMHVLLI